MGGKPPLLTENSPGRETEIVQEKVEVGLRSALPALMQRFFPFWAALYQIPLRGQDDPFFPLLLVTALSKPNSPGVHKKKHLYECLHFIFTREVETTTPWGTSLPSPPPPICLSVCFFKLESWGSKQFKLLKVLKVLSLVSWKAGTQLQAFWSLC